MLRKRLTKFVTFTVLAIFLHFAGNPFTGLGQTPVPAQITEYCWSPVSSAPSDSASCFFRKKFTLVSPEQSQLAVATTGKWAVYLNGKKAFEGEGSQTTQSFDAKDFLYPGVNLIAVEVQKASTGNGLGLKLRVKEKNEVRWRALAIDSTWLTHQSWFEDWQKPTFRDLSWLAAVPATPVFSSQSEKLTTGKPSVKESVVVSDTPDKGVEVRDKPNSSDPVTDSIEPEILLPATASDTVPVQQISKSNTTSSQPEAIEATKTTVEALSDEIRQPGPAEAITTVPQFQLVDDFRIDPIMSGEETGSIIAMSFDEFGHLIFSQEGGHLKVADLTIPFGTPRVVSLCEEVQNCQGILPMNGKVYVTGQGPNGLGLYLLERPSPTSVTMKVTKTLVKFKGEMGEHGPHGLTLGPDGMIYCVVGNASGLPDNLMNKGPYQHPYDTDLRPRYEDPSGHASGIKAPGGLVIRMALDGTRIEIVAGGLRNAYDLVFNQNDDLFVHDSDMESDLELPWYRPTALYHVTDGADLGWRSGWSKFPYYYFDTIEPVATTGRGSPAGAVCYDHLQFPARYHGALFLADWSEGRVLAVHQTREGSTYRTDVEEFLKGKPLNVTDIDIGEDGALYLATGGRGTSGGVYRVAWTGEVPESVYQFEDDVVKIVRHPQPNSAWARQNLAMIVTQGGLNWKKELEKVVIDQNNTAAIRCRAIESLYLLGMFDNSTLAKQLLQDPDEVIRAKTVYMCGLVPDWNALCVMMLSDSSPFVKRRAAEALLRGTTQVPLESLLPLLQSDDHVIASIACRLLERLPVESWKNELMSSESVSDFKFGALALLRIQPNLANSYEILVRCSEFMDTFVNDVHFNDLLRTVQLALCRSNVDPQKISGFSEKIANEFPTSNPLLNRELVRVLAYLKATAHQNDYRDYLDNHSDDDETKILVAMYLASIGEELDDDTRLALIDYLSQSSARNDGGSYQLYLARCIRETTDNLTEAGIGTVIQRGDEWPYALVPAFYRLTPKTMVEKANELCELDRRLQKISDRDVVAQARLGIIALLAEGKTSAGDEYLRELWKAEPARRNEIVIGIAQNQSKENWTYMVASIPLLDDMTANEVLAAIEKTPLKPVAAQHYRDLLELGYRLRGNGALQVSKVLSLWTQEVPSSTTADWKSQLDAWSRWFEKRWPDEKPVSTSAEQPANVGSLNADVLRQLEQGQLPGSPERGLMVFTKADCAKCHRFGSTGDSSGPDLTSLASRFSKRETLESIVQPSKVVSDRYQSTLVQSDQGSTFVGLKVDNGDHSITIIQSDSQRIRLHEDEIVAMKKVKESAMPEGLLQKLSTQDVADLIAFLYNENGNATAQQPIGQQLK